MQSREKRKKRNCCRGEARNRCPSTLLSTAAPGFNGYAAVVERNAFFDHQPSLKGRAQKYKWLTLLYRLICAEAPRSSPRSRTSNRDDSNAQKLSTNYFSEGNKLYLSDRTGHLTLEIVFGETRCDLARKWTDSPFAFLERISAI